MAGYRFRRRAPRRVRRPDLLHEPAQPGQPVDGRLPREHQEAGPWLGTGARGLRAVDRGHLALLLARAGAPSCGVRLLPAVAALRRRVARRVRGAAGHAGRPGARGRVGTGGGGRPGGLRARRVPQSLTRVDSEKNPICLLRIAPVFLIVYSTTRFDSQTARAAFFCRRSPETTCESVSHTTKNPIPRPTQRPTVPVTRLRNGTIRRPSLRWSRLSVSSAA